MTQNQCCECLGTHPGGITCKEMLGVVTSWEGDDPNLNALHFEIVSTYLIQHPNGLTAPALQALKSVFKQRLQHGVSIEQIRTLITREFDGFVTVTESIDAPLKEPRHWPLTIDYVFVGGPLHAVQRTLQWASATLNTRGVDIP